MKQRGLIPAAAGAAIAAMAVVAIYESNAYLARTETRVGRDSAPHSGAQKEIEHGRTASSRAPFAHPGKGSEERTPAEAARSSPPSPVSNQLDPVNSKLGSVLREKEDLQREKRRLETQLHTLKDEVAERDRYAFDLDREDWKELAAQSRVKYRMPCLMPLEASWKVPQAELDKLGLSPDDGEILGEAHLRSNRRVWDVVRPLCLEIVHDPDVVALLGANSCLLLIEKVTGRNDPKAVTEARRQVAEVHAGVRPAPPADQPQAALFEAFMAITSEAQRFEADLAESFGPEEAKRIWHSMSCAATRN
jgi:hypothetical protein